MRIRQRITLWITGAGLLAGLVFSVIITAELIEQPYELLDDELDKQAHALVAGLSGADRLSSPDDRRMLEALGRLYWFKVFDGNGRVIRESVLTRYADLPLREGAAAYNVAATIPRRFASLEQDDSNEVTFRVRVFRIPANGGVYQVQIGRPMEKLQEEITDLVVAVGIGLGGCAVVLVAFGYFAAGRILRPIAEMGALAREINDQTLDRRIPLGRSRDELHILAATLNQMFDRLQWSFQRQKEFLANAAHELKTPLAMQRLFLGELVQRRDLPPELPSRVATQLQVVLRMDRLVKNLLELSTLELDQTVDASRFDLSGMVEEVVTEFEEIVQAAGLRLDTDLEKGIGLHGDREKLRRVVINLLDNAVKYNRREDGRIGVFLSATGQEARLRVDNTGDGIPAGERERIFDQFYRLDRSRASATGGSGLGLTIVRRIVDLHRGRIEIESEPGCWTRFTVILPRSS